MTVETCFRIIFGLLAIGFAILAVHNLVTGRTPAAGRNVTRIAEPRLYWGAIGQHVMAVALGAGAVLPIAGTPTRPHSLGLRRAAVQSARFRPEPGRRPATRGRLAFLSLFLLATIAVILFA